ncbi:MAG: hypothetical protein HC780_04190 [Leptolyngbyaceae cyanobacterium CSU_1_3]|nr:hypothetical protein [Leptolyngbyaceae cyanobacterium CSU_1_3]
MSDVLLQNRDYTIVVAKTRPTLPATPPGYEQRWLKAHDAIVALAQTCEALDPDGITLYLSCRDASEQFKAYKQVKPEQLSDIFEAHYPPETVNLLDILKTVLDDYFARKAAQQTKPNGEMILVLIDGEPSDRMAISRLIVHTTDKLDRGSELGIGFIQLGDDLIARGFLAALDENLKSAGAKFDIVHTEVMEEMKTPSLTEFLLKVLGD